MTSNRPPNIILVITDDQGYGDLGCTGNPILKTPQIDRFHQDSIRLTNFHVGPTCAPTRSGLLTGHYANSTGVWHTIGGRSLLRKDEVTLATALRTAGYRTGIFGKWHLGDNYPYRPQDRGFDEVIVHGGGGISQTPDYWGNDYFDDTYSVNGELQAFAGYCTDVWFREAQDFITRNQEASFFCYIATNAPHSPFNVEPHYSKPYQYIVPEERANFYGMIANIDENFGNLRAHLQALDLEQDTILIFMTDNGTAAGVTLDDQGFVIDGYNAGLRGMKGSQYDGGHRVPFFMRWPMGGIINGQDIANITANVDVMPTLLDLCGISHSYTFHGQSLKSLLAGDTNSWPERILVTDSQRLTQPVKWRQSAVMTDQWRLIDGVALYDMSTDREQLNDVADQYSDVVANLRDEYERWWLLVSEQFERDIPISIGASGEPEVTLTCHDWRNEDSDCPWHQGMIRQGYAANGYWEIEVEQAGLYSFELRRWPATTQHAITAGIAGDDIAWKHDWISDSYTNWYSGGNPLSITEATLRLERPQAAPVTLVSRVKSDDAAVTFQYALEAGPAHLTTFFKDDANLSVGAYYVNIQLVG